MGDEVRRASLASRECAAASSHANRRRVPRQSDQVAEFEVYCESTASRGRGACGSQRGWRGNPAGRALSVAVENSEPAGVRLPALQVGRRKLDFDVARRACSNGQRDLMAEATIRLADEQAMDAWRDVADLKLALVVRHRIEGVIERVHPGAHPRMDVASQTDWSIAIGNKRLTVLSTGAGKDVEFIRGVERTAADVVVGGVAIGEFDCPPRVQGNNVRNKSVFALINDQRRLRFRVPSHCRRIGDQENDRVLQPMRLTVDFEQGPVPASVIR